MSITIWQSNGDKNQKPHHLVEDILRTNGLQFLTGVVINLSLNQQTRNAKRFSDDTTDEIRKAG